MTESLITEWLIDCADLSSTELHTFASSLSQDNEIVRALYAVLDERSKYSQVSNFYYCQIMETDYYIKSNSMFFNFHFLARRHSMQSTIRLLSLSRDRITAIYAPIFTNFDVHLPKFSRSWR